MNKTSIEWTDSTWNPIRGCSRVSEGCRNCYAEKVAYRFKGEGQPYEGLAVLRNGHASWTGEVRFIEEHLLDPLRWGSVVDCVGPTGGCMYRSWWVRGRRYGLCKCPTRPRRIFVNSMSDLFHENVRRHWKVKIFAVMAIAQQFHFQILTKRPAAMLAELSDSGFMREVLYEAAGIIESSWHKLKTMPRGFAWEGGRVEPQADAPWPLPNVWLGVSVEDQKAADERIPLLLATPAAVRFISAEPLLGPVDLARVDWVDEMERIYTQASNKPGEYAAGFAELAKSVRECAWEEGRAWRNVLTGAWFDGWDGNDNPEPLHHKLDWVICGGESGPGARPMHPEWARGLRDQCVAAGVPFFMKQMGSAYGPNKGHELPPDLDIKQFPEVARHG